MLVVTGATGFLGSHIVCALLRRGHQVVALKRPGSSLTEFNFVASAYFGNQSSAELKLLNWAEADIGDIHSLDEAFKGAEVVFHCAAAVSFTGSSSVLFKSNAHGTANVVDACLGAGVRKLVYASSTAAIGRTDESHIISEDAQWYDDSNNTAYASSKHLAELEIWRGVEEGLDCVVVNPGIILGIGNWNKGSCRIFRKIFKGLKFYTEGVNGFVGVRDVAEIMCSLAFSKVNNKRFILVSENLSYREVFSMIAEGFCNKAPAIEIKAVYLPFILPFFRLLAKIYPASNLSRETLRTSVKQYQYSNFRILNEGYTLTPVAQVIKESCAMYANKHADLTS